MLRSRARLPFGAALVAALLLVPTATLAQPRPGFGGGHAGDLLGRRLQGLKVLKRGSLAEMRGRKVAIGGGKTVAIGEIADKVFAEDNALEAELKKGSAALAGAPTTTDEVVETDDATVLVKTTAVVVKDPAKLAAASGRFKRFRKGATKPTLEDLDATGKAGFAKWKQEVAKYPADHPLKQALAKGDAALLEAVGAGVGDLVVTTAVVVPKSDLAVDADGALQLPTLGADGRLDHKKTRKQKRRFSDGKAKEPAEKTEKSVQEKGRLVHRARFLAGRTVGDAFEWSRRWKFTSGFFEVSAGAYYGFGLRAPVIVKAIVTPKTIAVTGPRDKANHFAVEVSASTADMGPEYYKDAGIAADKVFDGKELVLEAGFHLGYELEAGWGAFKKKGRVGKDFDQSQNFKPPFGDDCARSGSACGIELWIPPGVTNTGVKIGSNKLHVGGAAHLGFLLAGSGSVTVKYESLHADGVVKSAPKAGGDAKKTHSLTFDSARTLTMKTPLEPLDKPGSRNYGVVLSEPSYKWLLRIIPGLKVTVDVKAGKFIDRTFSTGAMWMHSLGIDLGTIRLDRHPGTVKRYRFKEGVRSWKK